MKTRYTVTGIEAVVKKLRKFPGELAKSVEKIVKLEARSLAEEYAKSTGPGLGLKESTLQKFSLQVAGEIKRVFGTTDAAWAVGKLIERRSPKLAAGYRRAIREGKLDQAKRYLREAGFKVDNLDRTLLKTARTGPYGNVPKTQEVVAIVNSTQLRVFIRDQQAKVGMAKAAWYQAAQGIVKRVRGNSRVGGVRRTYEKFPETVRKVSRRFPGLGGARIVGTGLETSVTIYTGVKHAPDAAVTVFFDSAQADAESNLTASIRYALRTITDKTFNL